MSNIAHNSSLNNWSVHMMNRRGYNPRIGDRMEAMIGTDRSLYGFTAKNREYLASMANDARLSEPIDQGSNLHMAMKLLKAENSNLEKIIILLKTENQKMQRKMKELEYQNDRFKVTQNQLKTELKREKEMVKYLHGLTKKHERTIQKKDAESRQLRREAREADKPERSPERKDRIERIERIESLERPPKLEKFEVPDKTDKPLNTERPQSVLISPSQKSRPQPPKRSDSFNIKRNGSRPFIVPRGDKSKTNAYNSDSAIIEKERTVNADISSLARYKSSNSVSPTTEGGGKKLNTTTDEISTEWDDVTDVLGFLNEKVNQFERLLVETGGSSNSGSGYSSSDTIGPGK